MRTVLLCLVVLGVAADAVAEESSRARAALVVAAPPGPTPAQLEAARATLGKKLALVDSAALRRALEGFGVGPSAEARVREALERARRRMRQLDLAGVSAALDEAEVAATALSPTPEARALFAQVFVRRAGAALAARDPRGASRAVGLALAAAPDLVLETGDASPPMVQLLETERGRRARSPRVTVALTAEGAPAQVSIEGTARGATPLRLADVPRGALVVWWVRQGYAPKVTWAELAGPTSLSTSLSPLDEVTVAAPLVEALRRADARARPDAARALAAALGVEVIALLGADPQAPLAIVELERALAASPGLAFRADDAEAGRLSAAPAKPRRSPWYRRGWVWGVIGGGVVVAGGAVALGVLLGRSSPTSNPSVIDTGTVITCCR